MVTFQPGTGPRQVEWHPAGRPDASVSVIKGWYSDCGALISGRRTFDIAGGWKGGHPIDVPIFDVTHEAPTEGEWSLRVSFVTEGLERAVELAKDAAGDRAVSVGSADLTQQLLRAGLLDEIESASSRTCSDRGVRLFDRLGPVELEQVSAIPSDGVTHLRYRVKR